MKRLSQLLERFFKEFKDEVQQSLDGEALDAVVERKLGFKLYPKPNYFKYVGFLFGMLIGFVFLVWYIPQLRSYVLVSTGVYRYATVHELKTAAKVNPKDSVGTVTIDLGKTPVSDSIRSFVEVVAYEKNKRIPVKFDVSSNGPRVKLTIRDPAYDFVVVRIKRGLMFTDNTVLKNDLSRLIFLRHRPWFNLVDSGFVPASFRVIEFWYDHDFSRSQDKARSLNARGDFKLKTGQKHFAEYDASRLFSVARPASLNIDGIAFKVYPVPAGKYVKPRFTYVSDGEFRFGMRGGDFGPFQFKLYKADLNQLEPYWSSFAQKDIKLNTGPPFKAYSSAQQEVKVPYGLYILEISSESFSEKVPVVSTPLKVWSFYDSSSRVLYFAGLEKKEPLTQYSARVYVRYLDGSTEARDLRVSNTLGSLEFSKPLADYAVLVFYKNRYGFTSNVAEDNYQKALSSLKPVSDSVIWLAGGRVAQLLRRDGSFELYGKQVTSVGYCVLPPGRVRGLKKPYLELFRQKLRVDNLFGVVFVPADKLSEAYQSCDGAVYVGVYDGDKLVGIHKYSEPAERRDLPALFIDPSLKVVKKDQKVRVAIVRVPYAENKLDSLVLSFYRLDIRRGQIFKGEFISKKTFKLGEDQQSFVFEPANMIGIPAYVEVTGLRDGQVVDTEVVYYLPEPVLSVDLSKGGFIKSVVDPVSVRFSSYSGELIGAIEIINHKGEIVKPLEGVHKDYKLDFVSLPEGEYYARVYKNKRLLQVLYLGKVIGSAQKSQIHVSEDKNRVDFGIPQTGTTEFLALIRDGVLASWTRLDLTNPYIGKLDFKRDYTICLGNSCVKNVRTVRDFACEYRTKANDLVIENLPVNAGMAIVKIGDLVHSYKIKQGVLEISGRGVQLPPGLYNAEVYLLGKGIGVYRCRVKIPVKAGVYFKVEGQKVLIFNNTASSFGDTLVFRQKNHFVPLKIAPFSTAMVKLPFTPEKLEFKKTKDAKLLPEYKLAQVLRKDTLSTLYKDVDWLVAQIVESLYARDKERLDKLLQQLKPLSYEHWLRFKYYEQKVLGE